MSKSYKFILSMLFFIAGVVYADSPASPSTYKVISSNEKYVFVMIAPLTLEQEVKHWIESKQKETFEIRSMYPKSGMYINDGSKEPLWTVDWFSDDVEIANDGLYLVRPGPWARVLEDDAITFYKNGQLIKNYKINQLISKKRKLEYTVSHFFWEKQSLFDREKMKYYIETLDGKHFIFDIKTGEILSPIK